MPNLNNFHFDRWRHSLGSWLDGMSEGLEPGRFRFCSEGSSVPTAGHAAQFVTCFAMKAAWQAGLWDSWNKERKDACISFIRSFQVPDGWFCDPWLSNASKPRWRELGKTILRSAVGRGSWGNLANRQEMNLRAETRQSVSTLAMVEARPEYPLPMPWKSPDDVLCFLRGLDWRFPWSAGSHLSHLAFILRFNKNCFPDVPVAESLFDVVFDFLSRIRDVKSGAWFRGNVSDTEKVNGAMKILTAWEWMDHPLPDCSKLIDLALKQSCLQDGCGFLNRLFVVYAARKSCSSAYRRDEIRQLAADSLLRIARFEKSDGGFSFFEKHAQTTYYGARVSKGLPVSDMHGAALMVWAIAICADLIGEDTRGKQSGWRAHRA